MLADLIVTQSNGILIFCKDSEIKKQKEQLQICNFDHRVLAL